LRAVPTQIVASRPLVVTPSAAATASADVADIVPTPSFFFLLLLLLLPSICHTSAVSAVLSKIAATTRRTSALVSDRVFCRLFIVRLTRPCGGGGLRLASSSSGTSTITVHGLAGAASTAGGFFHSNGSACRLGFFPRPKLARGGRCCSSCCILLRCHLLAITSSVGSGSFGGILVRRRVAVSITAPALLAANPTAITAAVAGVSRVSVSTTTATTTAAATARDIVVPAQLEALLVRALADGAVSEARDGLFRVPPVSKRGNGVHHAVFPALAFLAGASGNVKREELAKAIQELAHETLVAQRNAIHVDLCCCCC
jgi:hypothetical protein